MITRDDIGELARFECAEGGAVSFYYQPSTPQNKSHREEVADEREHVGGKDGGGTGRPEDGQAARRGPAVFGRVAGRRAVGGAGRYGRNWWTRAARRPTSPAASTSRRRGSLVNWVLFSLLGIATTMVWERRKRPAATPERRRSAGTRRSSAARCWPCWSSPSCSNCFSSCWASWRSTSTTSTARRLSSSSWCRFRCWQPRSAC